MEYDALFCGIADDFESIRGGQELLQLQIQQLKEKTDELELICKELRKNLEISRKREWYDKGIPQRDLGIVEFTYS